MLCFISFGNASAASCKLYPHTSSSNLQRPLSCRKGTMTHHIRAIRGNTGLCCKTGFHYTRRHSCHSQHLRHHSVHSYACGFVFHHRTFRCSYQNRPSCHSYRCSYRKPVSWQVCRHHSCYRQRFGHRFGGKLHYAFAGLAHSCCYSPTKCRFATNMNNLSSLCSSGFLNTGYHSLSRPH